jgi:hypothetical protein
MRLSREKQGAVVIYHRVLVIGDMREALMQS